MCKKVHIYKRTPLKLWFFVPSLRFDEGLVVMLVLLGVES